MWLLSLWRKGQLKPGQCKGFQIKGPRGLLSTHLNEQDDEIRGFEFHPRTQVVSMIAFTQQPIQQKEYHLPSL